LTLLGTIGVLIVILYYFTAQIRQERHFVQLALEDEIAHQIAEAAAEEAIATIRQHANAENAPIKTLFTSAASASILIQTPLTREAAWRHHPSLAPEVTVSLQILDTLPLDDASPCDRTGHLKLSATAKAGGGQSRLLLVKQFRILDMGVPPAMRCFDAVTRVNGAWVGAVKHLLRGWEVRPLTATETAVLETEWQTRVSLSGVSHLVRGIPFSRRRITQFFPTWQDLKAYCGSPGLDRLTIYGDTLCADRLSLQLDARTLCSGFGRLYSQESPIVFRKTPVASQSAIELAVLEHGGITLEGYGRGEHLPFGIWLPNGRLNLAGKGSLHGFLLAENLEGSIADVDLEPAPERKRPLLKIAISGQTEIWREEAPE